MRVVLARASAVCCAFVLATSSAGAGDRPNNRFPNELRGFRFYSKYLAPLQPGLSGEDAVRRVLGDTAAVQRNGWRIVPTYTMKSGAASNPTQGPLYQIILRPDGVIPMGAVKFSAAFTHSHSSLSEINIGFDVYRDRFGLEYWLHEENSEWGKKGDLYWIVYGASQAALSSAQGTLPCDCADVQAAAITCLTETQMSTQVKHIEMQPDRMGNHVNVRGVAVFELMIGRNGRVLNAKAISGHPVAINLLLGSADKWRFTPFVRDGVPRQTCGRMIVKFSIVENHPKVEVARP